MTLKRVFYEYAKTWVFWSIPVGLVVAVIYTWFIGDWSLPIYLMNVGVWAISWFFGALLVALADMAKYKLKLVQMRRNIAKSMQKSVAMDTYIKNLIRQENDEE